MGGGGGGSCPTPLKFACVGKGRGGRRTGGHSSGAV